VNDSINWTPATARGSHKMPFIADRAACTLDDAVRHWSLMNKGGMTTTRFHLRHRSGAEVQFTGQSMPERATPDSQFVSNWRITAVGHTPSDEVALSDVEQRELITEAMSAYGYFFGDGAGPAFLTFD
jgi:hypothetical protein